MKIDLTFDELDDAFKDAIIQHMANKYDLYIPTSVKKDGMRIQYEEDSVGVHIVKKKEKSTDSGVLPE